MSQASSQSGKATGGALARAIRAAPGKLLGGDERNPSMAPYSRATFKAAGVLPTATDQSKRTRTEPMRGRGNATVYLVAYPRPDDGVSKGDAEAQTRATRDVHDRAHQMRDDQTGMLLPAAGLNGHATARRYPPSHMNSRGVAVDSQFDELYERLLWIEREIGDVPGMGRTSAMSNAAESIEAAARKAGSGRGLRAAVEGKRRL